MNEHNNQAPASIGMKHTITVASGVAEDVRMERSLNGARVTGWIMAGSRASAFLAAKEVAAVFGRESIGAWIDAEPGEAVIAPFEFEVPRQRHQESFEQIAARLTQILQPAP